MIFSSLCTQLGLPEPVPEYQFAKDAGRMWRIDWYFEYNKIMVGLEVEGGVHIGGRHTRGAGFEADIEKYNAMSCRGIWLIRVTPKNLINIETINMIKKILYK